MKMKSQCCRPCKRVLRWRSFVAIVTLSSLWCIGFSNVWTQLVKSDPANQAMNNLAYRHSIRPLQRQSSLSTLLSDGETNIPAIKLLGHPRQHSVFLTIGIPTVCRVHHRYLHTTLTSIINNTALTDRDRIHIVIAVSYLNKTCAQEVKDTIKEMFSTHVDSGLVELIGIPVEAYPSVRNLRNTFNDEDYRVQWRSKQNIDYSFLMAYNIDMAMYYMHLEDDVTTVPGYLHEIEKYINKTTEYWAMLEFSSLGFIGKLFRSSDLPKMATFLRNFYSEQPCDYLMIYFMNLMVQRGRFLKVPTLFQHHGLHSSLPNLIRNISDQFYSTAGKTLNGDNPSAHIYTSLTTYSNHYPKKSYDKNETGVFWSLTPKVGDTLTIVFKKNQCLERFALISGFPGKATDQIIGGIVELGNRPLPLADDNVYCSGLSYLGEIQHGTIDVRNITSNSGCVRPESRTSCIKFTFTERHTEWVVISEIAVFTRS